MKIIQIHTPDRPIDWPAWDTRTPGLVLTPGVGTQNTPDGSWALTHVPTGRSVGRAWDDPLDVHVLAQRLGDLGIDWEALATIEDVEAMPKEQTAAVAQTIKDCRKELEDQRALEWR